MLDSVWLHNTYQLTSPWLFLSFDSCKFLLSAFVNVTALSFLQSQQQHLQNISWRLCKSLLQFLETTSRYNYLDTFIKLLQAHLVCVCFTFNLRAWNTQMGVLKSNAILCNALVNYTQSANCNIISEPHKKTVCTLRLKVWIECWSCSIHLPRTHLELQCEQKMKRCHHPHLQQIDLDWMSTLALKEANNSEKGYCLINVTSI